LFLKRDVFYFTYLTSNSDEEEMVAKEATGVGIHLDFSEINLSYTVSVIEHDLEVWEEFFL